MRALSGQQFVQYRAERINVGRRRHCQATDLFRTGVIRCHHPHHRCRLGRESRRISFGLRRIEQLGDAEVQKLRHTVTINQNVARFDVAMRDQFLMRVLNGAANLTEELDAVGN